MKADMPTPPPQLSPEELIAIRAVLKDAEHATWLRKQLFIVGPIIFAVASAVIAAVNWVVTHLSFR